MTNRLRELLDEYRAGQRTADETAISAQAFIRELLSQRPEIRLATGYVHELAHELMVRRPEKLLLHIPA